MIGRIGGKKPLWYRTGVRCRDQERPVDGGRGCSPRKIAGVAVASSIFCCGAIGPRANNPQTYQPRASVRSASAPIAGASTRAYSLVR